MVIDIHQVEVVYQSEAMPKSTKRRRTTAVRHGPVALESLTGVHITHDIAQAQPIIIDARFGVRFDRYVNGRVMEKYRSKQISKRLATDAFDIV